MLVLCENCVFKHMTNNIFQVIGFGDPCPPTGPQSGLLESFLLSSGSLWY